MGQGVLLHFLRSVSTNGQQAEVPLNAGTHRSRIILAPQPITHTRVERLGGVLLDPPLCVRSLCGRCPVRHRTGVASGCALRIPPFVLSLVFVLAPLRAARK